MNNHNKENVSVSIRVLLIIAGLYAIGSHLHTLLKLYLLEPNLLDFAYYYVWGDLLNKGINFFQLDCLNQKSLEFLLTPTNIPISHLRDRTILSFISSGLVLYSPAFLVSMSLFAKMDFNNAALIWTLLNYSALMVSIFVLMRTLDIKMDTINFSILSFLVFSFHPLIECTAIGQSNLLILCMLVLSLWAVKSKRPYMAGLFMSIAIHIKPQYGFIALLFLLNRMYKPLISTIVSYCLISAVAIVVVGINFQIDYFIGLFNIGEYTYNKITWEGNISLLSAATRLLDGRYIDEARIIHAMIAVAFILYTIKQFWRPYNKNLFILEFAWMIALLLLFLPMLEEHYLVLLYFPILVIYAYLNNLNRFWQSTFIIGFLLVAMKYSLVRFEIFNSGLPSLLA
ncbi:MAG: glycosyltransferase family 87 protein, partial [bacterium]